MFQREQIRTEKKERKKKGRNRRFEKVSRYNEKDMADITRVYLERG